MLDDAGFDVTSLCRIVLDGVVSVARQVHDFTRTRGLASQTICPPNELSTAGELRLCRSAPRGTRPRHARTTARPAPPAGGLVHTDTEECLRTDVHRRGPAALNLAGDGHRLVDRDREALPAPE